MNIPAVGYINPTVVVCQKMHHHTALFLKSKNTTTTSSRRCFRASLLSIKKGNDDDSLFSIKKGDDEDNDAEKPTRIFGGHFDEPYSFSEDFMYSVSTNDLGPKFELALENGMDHTIGIDLVAKSLNDLVTVGPCRDLLFTYDIDAGFSEKVISCMADAFKQSIPDAMKQCLLSFCYFHGETMSDHTTSACAFVEKESVIDGRKIEVGDVVIGLPSSGIHSGGFPLVRRVLERSGCSLKDNLPGTNITLGESLMTPTVIYKKQVHKIISKGGVKGIAHITGGGLTENVTRTFPSGLGAVIYNDSWIVPPIFKWIQEEGRIGDAEMRRTFNMGIGMVLVVSQESAKRILQKSSKIIAYQIGEVVRVNTVMYQ